MLRRAWVVALLLMGSACRDEPPPPPSSSAVEATPEPLPRMVFDDPTQVVVHHADQLEQVDLTQVKSIDLAMSPTDQVGHLDEIDPQTACSRLDLVKLAALTPELERLRISGCQGAVHAGLGAFNDRLETLELADLVLDGVTIGNLSRLGGLRSLTLTRIEASPDPMGPLQALPLRKLVLRDLQRDSDVALMLDLWPKRLRHVVLEGDWAAHKAMLTLARAEALEKLELRNTRVGNFSLNQIRGLLRLREVTFEGSTFNDRTPQYFRELPVVKFSCTCRRLGDTGLRALRHSEGIRWLELRETQITGAGLEALEELVLLETLVLLDRDIGAEGFEHLAMLSKLRHLELSGPIDDPRMPGLGALTELRTLRLSHPRLDDRVAPELSALTELEVLDLGRTSISDEGLSAVAGLQALRVLRLDHTRVTNRGLEHLGKLAALEVLALQSTDVVDEGVAHLGKLQKLRELRLDRTLITDAALDTLVKLEALERLNLAHTVVTGQGVAKLKGLPKLDVLEIAGVRG